MSANGQTISAWPTRRAVLGLLVGAAVSCSRSRNFPSSPIENALRGAKPGVEVSLDMGTYEVHRPIEVPRGVALIGDGVMLRPSRIMGSILRLESECKISGLTIKAGGFSRSILDVAEGASDVVVEHCSLNGDRSERFAIWIGRGTSRLSISDTRIKGVMHGINISGLSDGVVVERVEIADWTTRGIRVSGNDRGTSTGLRIRDVEISPNVGNGKSRYPIVISSTEGRHEDIRVEGCHIQGRERAWQDTIEPGTADQLTVRMTNGVIIQDNFVAGGGERGINVTACSDVLVTNNVVNSSDTVGIGIGSSRRGNNVEKVRVVANTVTNAGLNRAATTPDESLTAIRLTQVQGGEVRGNHLIRTSDNQTQRYGIFVDDDVFAVDVTDNRVSGDLIEVREPVR